MGFIVVLVLVTLTIAASAAFFSVYGLAQIFTGSFWPVVIMASSLEAGKLVTASFLYRFWGDISFVMKTYMISAVVVLMILTSAGIFGYLSSAYQQDILGTKINRQQIELLQQENAQLESLKQERLDRKRQIDNDIASLPNNYVTGRQRLLESYGSELQQLKEDIATYTEQIRTNTTRISELKAANLEQEAHVGPIIFIAKAFDQDIDDTTKWLILVIIFAFDPLAVMLTVGANIAISKHKTTKKQQSPDTVNEYGEPAPSVVNEDQIDAVVSEGADWNKIKQYIDSLVDSDTAPDPNLEEHIKRKHLLNELRSTKKG